MVQPWLEARERGPLQGAAQPTPTCQAVWLLAGHGVAPHNLSLICCGFPKVPHSIVMRTQVPLHEPAMRAQ